MMQPLLQDLGYLANTPQAQQILDGTYHPPPGTDPYMVKFLDKLRMPERVHAKLVPATVSTQEHQIFWNKMGEAKGSEKTELSNAHYKAAAQDDKLAAVDTSLRQMPYRHGFAPE
jgi:hypothetical protein